MDIKYRLYPYPVLATFSDSYVDSKYEIIVKGPKLEGYEITIEIQVILENEGLKNLVKRGLASYVYHLECSHTGYRRVVETDKEACRITIKDTQINGDLDLCPFILAKEDIAGYFNEKFNTEDYPDPVDIQKGWPLAIGKQFTWPITKKNTDLMNSSSPFRIRSNPDPSIAQMSVEYGSSDPKLRIYLCKNDFDTYYAMQSNADVRSILNSMIVVPALIFVLSELQNADDPEDMDSTYSGTEWYDSIKDSLEKRFNKDIKSLKNENIFELAQKLLRTPVNDAMVDLTHLGTKHLPEEDE